MTDNDLSVERIAEIRGELVLFAGKYPFAPIYSTLVDAVRALDLALDGLALTAANARIDNLCSWMNNRVEVEQVLFDAARGKRALPDAKECRKLAMRLGDPSSKSIVAELSVATTGSVE